MRVRWALEQVGRACDVGFMSFDGLKQPAHRALHPFGQIPTWQEGDLVLFESGAIVLHVADGHPGLLPDDAPGRARAIAWMFAALDTVEPPIWEFDTAQVLEGGMPWQAAREPMLRDRGRPFAPNCVRPPGSLIHSVCAGPHASSRPRSSTITGPG